MTLDEFQKYKALKSYVEESYPDKEECKDVWHSVKRMILNCNEHDIWQDQLEIFFQMSETGINNSVSGYEHAFSGKSFGQKVDCRFLCWDEIHC